MNLEKIRGQDRALLHLEKLLSSKPMPQALLFFGPEGVGKSLAARETAKALLCSEAPPDRRPCGNCASCISAERGLQPDIKIVDAAYQAALREEDVSKQKTLRVDTIRHLRHDMSLNSLLGGFKVAVIEDADKLEIEAANALLKIIEEPPPGTFWLLTSSRPGRLLPTIASRCLRISFADLETEFIFELLIEKGTDRDKARELSTICEGSIGRALELAQEENPIPFAATDPSALLKAAELLGTELAPARRKVSAALWAATQKMRLKYLSGETAFARVEKPLRDIEWLKRALESNVDPKTIFLLAGQAVEEAQ